jgi:hypothetical protein
MRQKNIQRLHGAFAVSLLVLILFGLGVAFLEASVCEEAFILCMFDQGPIYPFEFVRMAFCGNGYYFCKKYIDPV